MVYVKRLPGVRRYYRRNLVNLPDDTLLLLLLYLDIEDLQKMRRVCRRINYLIQNSPSVLVHTSFSKIWPTPKNVPVFERASQAGNVEATIKMGIGYLYNEGVSENSSKKISPELNISNAEKAAKYFCQAEKFTSQAVAFIWSFIRPPWAAGAMCCKRHVFNSIEAYCNKNEDADPSILFSLGKVLSLQEGEGDHKNLHAKSQFWLEKAVLQGSTLAKFELWKQKTKSNREPALKLQQLRELRECLQGNKEAELELAMNYASGNVGNLDGETATETIKQFLASSLHYRRRGIFQFQTDVNCRMRYILVDWLIEVSTMKDFSQHVLHAAIWYMDQYLSQRKSYRAQLQLLGIGCVLIASRFYGEDIITIRESSWLTDNTYAYEKVVRMIGEIMGCLKGETQVLTVPNYIKLFCELIKVDRKVENFAFYVADLTLLRESCGRYTCAVVALSCTLLGKLICHPETTWCSSWEMFLPFNKLLVLNCMNFLFEKCLLDFFADQQTVKLKAVKERYQSSRFSEVSTMKIPSKDEMNELMRHFSTADEKSYESSEESALNTTMCSIASSGYDGDEEDFEDIGDPEGDEEEMMWNDESLEQQARAGHGKSSVKDSGAEMEVLDSDQIERSTPSFLSPGWLQNIVKDSTSASTRRHSACNVASQAGLARVQYYSVGANASPARVHSRRPLMDVNRRRTSPSPGSGLTSRKQQFKPIQNTNKDPENVDMNC